MTIQPHHVQVDREQAKDLYKSYKAHVHYSTPVDREIQRTYQLIAQGRVVIRVIDSIKAAGVNEAKQPKLAICRADAADCWLEIGGDGSGVYSMDQWPKTRWRAGGGLLHWRRSVQMPAGTFTHQTRKIKATLPIIPIHLRPKRGLANYHVLWEAEWQPVPPRDPLLLRRVGRSDLWLVVAAWDLTEVERAVLATRMNG